MSFMQQSHTALVAAGKTHTHMEGDSIAEEAKRRSTPLQAEAADMRHQHVMSADNALMQHLQGIMVHKACKMWPHIKKHSMQLPMLAPDTMVPKMWCSQQY